MKTVEDVRLEELRKFLIGPTQLRTPDELTDIARDLTWVIEAEQLRRVNERVHFTPEPPKPRLLFGNTEAVLKYVEEKGLTDVQWRHIEKTDDLTHVLPRQFLGVKLEGTDLELWRTWGALCDLYQEDAS